MEEVHTLILVIADKIRNCRQSLRSQEMANACYGLQKLTNSDEVCHGANLFSIVELSKISFTSCQTVQMI